MNEIEPRRIIRVYTCLSQGPALQFHGEKSGAMALRQQVRFLRRQFVQDGDLPFSNVLSEELVTRAISAVEVSWIDRIYSPLVTLWVFLGQVLSADSCCRSVAMETTPCLRL
jgi:hypothetical protein